jgi:hypothetical protein
MYDKWAKKKIERNNKTRCFGYQIIFSVYINGFNAGNNRLPFYVSAAGVQMDCLATEDGDKAAMQKT